MSCHLLRNVQMHYYQCHNRHFNISSCVFSFSILFLGELNVYFIFRQSTRHSAQQTMIKPVTHSYHQYKENYQHDQNDTEFRRPTAKKKIGFAARQKLASRLPTKAVVSVTSPSSGGRVVEEHNTSLRQHESGLQRVLIRGASPTYAEMTNDFLPFLHDCTFLRRCT